ncbi:Alpha/Beta hydrolase protein [Halteromyces radiatus]|uniref:Alpha/Beta hydrolase protein n=1 Tax=Halteromyces radiatus TaxID=101107 RepID=UPI00221FD0DB|nr:Alpha/Beta hydrolase protein [Halteromyces radiatus]KAI8092982.1 Alpha/Beta hydrolase protein [Halteromyces radiatus]
MDSIRKQLRKLPPSAVIKVLRKAFAMPAGAARLILNDITKPRASHKPWIRKVSHPEWSGCWIGEQVSTLDDDSLYERVEQADVLIFNVHGGGFRIGKCTMYMDTYIGWIQQLKKLYNLKVMIMSVDYRLAPEFRYPSPVEDIVRAYEHLILGLNIDPHKVVAIGDSAGAALILEMLFITHDPSMFEIVTDDMDNGEQGSAPMISELPRPAATVLVSPLVTDETTSQSWKENVKYDYISQYTAKVIKRDYFEPTKPDDDTPPSSRHSSSGNEDSSQQVLGIAKLQTGFQAFLSNYVLMYVGNLEVLRDDALDLAAKAKDDGVKWTTVAEDCVHDWFCVREVVKDKKVLERADKVFADFVYKAIGEYRHHQSMLDLSMRRASEGLHTVNEEHGEYEDDDDDDDDDEFHEVMTVDDLGATLEGIRLATSDKHSRSSKSSSSMLYV